MFPVASAISSWSAKETSLWKESIEKRSFPQEKIDGIFKSVNKTNPATNFLRKLHPSRIVIVNTTNDLQILQILFKSLYAGKKKAGYFDYQKSLFPGETVQISAEDVYKDFFHKPGIEEILQQSTADSRGYYWIKEYVEYLQFHTIETIEAPEEQLSINFESSQPCQNSLCFYLARQTRPSFLGTQPMPQLYERPSRIKDPLFLTLHGTRFCDLFTLQEELWTCFSPDKRVPIDKIPLTHHAIYFGFDPADKGLPDRFEINMRSWIKRMPNMEHAIWTLKNIWPDENKYKAFTEWCAHFNVAIHEFSNEEKEWSVQLPFTYRLFCLSLQQCHWAIASDLVRLWVLFKNGGVYADLDVKLYEDLTPLLRLYRFILGGESLDSYWAGNAFMAFEPDNSFLKVFIVCLERIIETHAFNILKEDSLYFHIPYSVLSLTGPINLSMTLLRTANSLAASHVSFEEEKHFLHGGVILPQPYLYPGDDKINAWTLCKHENVHSWCYNR